MLNVTFSYLVVLSAIMLSVVGVSVGAPALRAEWPILKEVATFQDNCLELRRQPNNIFPSNFLGATTFSIMPFSIMTLTQHKGFVCDTQRLAKQLCHLSECRYTEFRVLFIVMLSIIVLSVVKLNAFTLSVLATFPPRPPPPLALWYNTRPVILSSGVRIIPTGPRERKKEREREKKSN
jgi:hypothetical protein